MNNPIIVRDCAGDDLRRFERLLESVFGEPGWSPAVDISETDGELIVSAALPGVSKDEVALEVKDGRLILSGQLKNGDKKEEVWLRRELPQGPFRRSFELPAEIDASRASAALRDGILELRLPKAERAKPQKIAIN
ncbi:MAG: Hsp20/alpha crystallin family protein [Elusimicrobia bacterium]|nr:Hsp20/alpha crystallin family protein [Elusimicrobiota bacterium]MDE2424278.1 Hsp20/alpha crystallin family protein [Elusimicrobiota bacterium]